MDNNCKVSKLTKDNYLIWTHSIKSILMAVESYDYITGKKQDKANHPVLQFLLFVVMNSSMCDGGGNLEKMMWGSDELRVQTPRAGARRENLVQE